MGGHRVLWSWPLSRELEEARPLIHLTFSGGLPSMDFSGGQVGFGGKWGFWTIRKFGSLGQLDPWLWTFDLGYFNLPCPTTNKTSSHAIHIQCWAEPQELFNNCFNFISWSQLALLDAWTYWSFYLTAQLSLIKCRAKPILQHKHVIAMYCWDGNLLVM